MLAWSSFLPLLAILLGFVLSPTGSQEAQTQGRLLEAPSAYVRQKLFDEDFVTTLVEQRGASDFFYPLRIRKLGEASLVEARSDHAYARGLTEIHAGFGSNVRIIASSVSRISIQEGSAWNGQYMMHTFSFSEMEGRNGTSTIFEYHKAWYGSILIHNLHKRKMYADWIGVGFGEWFYAKMIDLFVTTVEQSWAKDWSTFVNGRPSQSKV